MAEQLGGRATGEPTVLFVDADANAAAAGALTLERAEDGLVTGIERTAGAAAERLSEVDCLVVTDDLPDADPVAFVEGVRETFDGPVVFAARDGDERLASRAVAAGADEYVPVEGDGDVRGRREGRLVDRVRAAVDRVRDRRERPPYAAMTEAMPAGLCLVRDGEVAFANARMGRILEASPDDLEGRPLADLVGDGDRETVAELLAAADGDGVERASVGDRDRPDPELELYAARVGPGGSPGGENGSDPETGDRPAPTAGTNGSGPPAGENGATPPGARDVGDGVTGTLVVAHDVSDRRGRERRLAALHRATREMLRSKRADDIAEMAVETAIETLDPLAASAYVYDRDDGQLRQAAGASGVVSAPGSTDPASLGTDRHDEFAWDVFVKGDPEVERRPEDAGIGARVAVPMGDYGVLVVATATPDALPDADVEFARTLATNVEVALDRAHRETTILDRTERLRDRTETLDRLRRIDAVVRDIGQLLVGATDRSEIETAVCERLAAVDGWAFAWIGERTVTGEGLDVRSRSEDADFLESVTAADPTGFAEAPAGTALRTGDHQRVGDVVAHPGAGDWREITLDHGFRSVVSIPLAHEGRQYGVLEVYGDDTDAFGDAEREVLVELGEMIAYAINAVERERALLAEGGPELELDIGDDEPFFARLAARIDARVTVDGVVPQSEGGYLTYLAVENGDDRDREDLVDAVESVGGRAAAVQEVRPLGEGTRFEVRLSEAPLFERVTAHGATVTEITAGDGGCVAQVELPSIVDVREFVEALRTNYPDLEVLAQRSPVGESEDVHADVADSMTDRQREVLEVAYHSGFFEWPRESTGEEIAETLDVAPPTFHKHVRTAERKLLTAILDRPGR